jgi:hypothetical protein
MMMECDNENPYARQAVIVPLAPVSKSQPDTNIVADDSGRAIVALLQKAAEMAKEDCARAIKPLKFLMGQNVKSPFSVRLESCRII